jgi:hypothetical protein
MLFRDELNFYCYAKIEEQPYWEIDLMQACIITKVVVTNICLLMYVSSHCLGNFIPVSLYLIQKVWNRTDECKDKSKPKTFYTKKLFPFWMILSQVPFQDVASGGSLAEAWSVAVARKSFKKHRRCSIWRVPEHTIAQFVRIQLERSDQLHVAQVEVFGIEGTEKLIGRVGSITCGQEVMAVTIPALPNQKDIENCYLRAVAADPYNADVLRQIPMYFNLYEKWGRGDSLTFCPNCIGHSLCEFCHVKNKFADELEIVGAGPHGRLRRLDSAEKILMDAKLSMPSENMSMPKIDIKKSVMERLSRVKRNLTASLYESVY